MLIQKASQLAEMSTLESIQVDDKNYQIQAYGVSAAGQILSLSHTEVGALVVAIDDRPHAVPFLWSGIQDEYPDGPIYNSKKQATTVAQYMRNPCEGN